MSSANGANCFDEAIVFAGNVQLMVTPPGDHI